MGHSATTATTTGSQRSREVSLRRNGFNEFKMQASEIETPRRFFVTQEKTPG
jgi:hypothetical protein